MRNVIIAFILIVVALSSVAMEELTFDTVGSDGNGHTVYSLLQDSRGGIWVGTQFGLYDYDGFRMHKAYEDNTISNTHVNAIVQRNDSLMLGTDNGLLVYDMATGRYGNPLSGIPGDVRAIVNSGSSMLVGTLSGLFEYNTSDSTVINLSDQLPHNTVYSIVSTPRGICVGTYNGLAFRPVSSDRFFPVRIAGYDAKRNMFVNALCYDRKSDHIYIGTEGALIDLDCASGISRRIAEFPGNSVKAIALDHTGAMIVGTDNGMYTIDSDGIRQYRHTVSSPMSLSNNRVWAIAVDRSNNVWAGTDYNISVAYRDSDYKSIPVSAITERDEGNRIYSIFRSSDGDLWLGGDHGIIRYKSDGKADWYMPGDESHPLSHSRVRDIFEDGADNLWIATDGGINRFNRLTGQFENHVLHNSCSQLNANWAYSVIEDSARRLWVGSYLGGILIGDRDSLAASPETEFNTMSGYDASTGLPNNFIHQMVCDDSGNVWCIYFKSESISCIEARSGKVSNFSIGTSPTYLFKDDMGHVWCGFQGGIGRLAADGTIPLPYKLPDAGNADIIAVGQVGGGLWLSTSEGVYVIDIVNGESRRLPLPASEYSAVYFDKDRGRVLLGGVDRILEVNPEIADADISQKPVLITSITVNGERYGSPGELRDVKNIFLDHNRNHIVLEFSDFEYGRQMRQRWEYRLAGDDDKWIRLPEGANSIDLANMSHGRHMLQIRPVSGSVESPVARELLIEIATPWYLTLWAFIVYIVLLISIAGGVWLYMHTRRRMYIERSNSAKAVESLQRDLRREKKAQLKPVEVISADDRQMSEVSRFVEENIADPDLSVAMIAEKLGMGQKQLYRLIKKQTEFSPGDYIRRERMNRAAALLAKRKMTVSEVMYSVGFSSSGYFSKCFQNQWGMTPKQYMEQADNQE